MTPDQQEACQRTAQAYIEFYQSPTPETLMDVDGLISDDIHFIDPFNDVRGRDSVHMVLEKMFEDVQSPKFDFLDVMWSNGLCFLRWDFSCHQRMMGHWTFRGMTELHFNDAGRICGHYDYWDSGVHFYAKLPYLGRLIRAIIRKASIG